jgi:hypothetical protein
VSFAVDASVIEANASRYHGKAPDEIEWSQPERQTRAVKEYIAALEAETEPNPDRKPPKVISPSDPCSAWTAKANKRVQFGYGLNYLIDIENAVIVDVEATPARTYDEVEATKMMLERTERRLELKPKRLAADTAYGTGRFLGWLVGRRIAPHIPVRDASERDVLWQRLQRAGLGATALYQRVLPEVAGVGNQVEARVPLTGARMFADRLLTLPVHSGVNEYDVARMLEIVRTV